jgi:soluble P-type ATPase
MIEVDIPGFKPLRLEHLVLDFNGTLACDGDLLPEVFERLNNLALMMTVHVITADTFGKVETRLEGVRCRLSILRGSDQDKGKLAYIKQLGPERTVCIGNGRNDRLMLEAAALGIVVLLQEGAAAQSLMAADIVCKDILSALDLFTHPLRLTATLRS